MKTKITLLSALCLFAISNLWATKSIVTDVSGFNSAWGTVDTIQVAEGTYTFNISNKAITANTVIIADPGASSKPVLEKIMFIFGSTTGYSFEVNGIEAYWDLEGASPITTSRYFIQATAGSITIPLIKIVNCNLHGFSRALIRMDNTTNIATLTSLIIDNSIISDMGMDSPSYSILALKTAKVAAASITNSTFYSCKNGVWYTEKTDFPVTFNMEKCCLIKVSGTGSKLLLNANTNPGSSYTLKNCVVSDSYDAVVTNMQFKIGSNGTDHFGYVDNVIFGNNMNTPKFTSTTLTTDIETQTSSFSYVYSTLNITTDPNTVNNVGDPRWRINGVWTATPAKNNIGAKVYVSNGNIVVSQLPTLATVEVYSINGRRLYSANAVSETMLIPVSERNAIVRVAANGTSQTYKVGF